MATPSAGDSQSEPHLTSQESAEIKEKARWLRRVVNPFTDFYLILAVGAAGSPTATEMAQRRQNRETQDHAKNLTPAQHKVYTEDFSEIVGHLPFLKTRLESNDPSRVIKKIINLVQARSAEARQSDTKGIKQGIVALIPTKYLPPGQDGDAAVNIYQHINVKNPGALKAWRGWENLITARLLCPIDHLAAFKANPNDTRDELRDGKLPLLDNSGDPKFPSFLYDEDTTDGSLTKGLLRGPLLLAVYLYIFVSPTAATGVRASSKRGNAKIHGMERVCPSTICYVAIQVYVALCCSKEWKEEWKGVKLPRLYVLLREHFTYPDDPWCTETLEWWNRKVFGDPSESDEEAGEMRDTQGPTLRERMEIERQARMQAAASNQ